MLFSALTDWTSCPYTCRLWWRMWEDHSAIPQNRLGGDSLSSRGGDGKWCGHYQDDHYCRGVSVIIHIQSFPDHNRVYNTNIYICSLQLSIYLIGFFFCVCVFCFFFLTQSSFRLVTSLLWLWPLLTSVRNNNTVLKFVTDQGQTSCLEELRCDVQV